MVATNKNRRIKMIQFLTMNMITKASLKVFSKVYAYFFQQIERKNKILNRNLAGILTQLMNSYQKQQTNWKDIKKMLLKIKI